MMQKNNWIKWLLFICISLVFQPAFANLNNGENLNLNNIGTTPSATSDLSEVMLKALFSGMPMFGSGKDGFASIFYVFNSGLWILAGVLGTYVLCTTILASRTGDLAGRYNVFMMTAKSAFGATMILPMANGYALIQVVSMWLILNGVAFANVLTSVFLSSDNLANSLSVTIPQPNVKSLTRNVLLMSMCMQAVQMEAQRTGDTSIEMGWSINNGFNAVELSNLSKGDNFDMQKLSEYIKDHDTDDITLQAGALNGAAGMSRRVCGEITISSFKVASEKGFASHMDVDTVNNGMAITTGGIIAVQGWDEAKSPEGQKKSIFERYAKTTAGVAYAGQAVVAEVSNLSSKNKAWQEWTKKLALKHADLTAEMIGKSQTIAKNILLQAYNHEVEENIKNIGSANKEEFAKRGIAVEKKSVQMNHSQIVTAMDGLASSYIMDFRKAAIGEYKDGSVMDSIIKKSNEKGWILLGYVIPQMASLTDKVNMMALDVPSSKASLTSPQPITNQEYNSKYLSQINQYFEQSKMFGGDDFQVATVNKSVSDSQSNAENQAKSGASMWQVMKDAMLNYMTNTAINDQEHPIMQMKRLGSLMLNAGGNIFILLTNYGTTGAASSSTGVMFGMIVWSLLSILMLGGFALAYILPMLPALQWTGMITGWLFMVLELMVIMPMWAVTNIALHQGDDFVGNQRIGFIMLLTMIMRPPLMVIGVIMTIVLMNVFGYFINTAYALIFPMADTGSGTFIDALIATATIPSMYAGMVYISTKEILSLMYKIPDNTLQIFGGGQQSLGAYGEKMSQGSVHAFGQINAAVVDPMKQSRETIRGYHQTKRNADLQQAGNLGDSLRQKQSRYESLENGIGLYGSAKNDFMMATMGSEFKQGSIDGLPAIVQDKEPLIANASPIDIKNGAEQILPASNDVKSNAIAAANQTAKQHEVNKGYKMGMSDYVRAINNNIMSERLGAARYDANRNAYVSTGNVEAQKNVNLLSNLSKLEGDYKGDPAAENAMQRNMLNRISGIADRSGMSQEKVANNMRTNMIGAMNQYSNTVVGHDVLDNSGNVTGEFMAGYMTKEPEYMQAGSKITGVARGYSQGDSSNLNNDILAYSTNNGNPTIKFSTSDNYGASIQQEQPVAPVVNTVQNPMMQNIDLDDRDAPPF